MRSDSIFKNLEAGQNRFELCHQAFKAVRLLHNPGHRIQDTTNDALHRLAGVVGEDASLNPVVPGEAAVEVTPDQLVIATQLETGLAESSRLSLRSNL